MDDVNELDALRGLLESDGWKLFTDQVEKGFGASAQIARIDAALAQVPFADREAAEEAVTHVRVGAKAVHTVMQWPVDRMKFLRAERSKPTGFLGRRRT